MPIVSFILGADISVPLTVSLFVLPYDDSEKSREHHLIDAPTNVDKWVCPFVRRSVCQPIRRSIKHRFYSIAIIFGINDGKLLRYLIFINDHMIFYSCIYSVPQYLSRLHNIYATAIYQTYSTRCLSNYELGI